MADPRFFKRASPRTLGEIAAFCSAKLANENDAGVMIEDVAPLSSASKGHITFLDNVKYKEQMRACRATACILHPKMAGFAPDGLALLLSEAPYKAYALTAQAFYPKAAPRRDISDKAVIHPTVELKGNIVVHPFAVIKEGARIGEGTVIHSGAVIGDNVVIGKNCIIGACASLSHALIGDGVTLYPGVRIGQDGFGFAIDPSGHVKVPQLGRVIIGDHVEVGANTTIDRGAGPDTVIGAGTWIDNLVQIGHNVTIGKGCVIVAQAGISGSTEIGDFVVIAGQVGIAGHLKIGSGARIGAKAGVMRDVEAGQEVLGQPAVPAKEFMRQVATLRKLSDKS